MDRVKENREECRSRKTQGHGVKLSEYRNGRQLSRTVRRRKGDTEDIEYEIR